MTTLVRTESPFNEFFQWLDLNRPTSLTDLIHYIPVETYTDDGAYVIRADLPGIDPESDIEVKIDGDVLTIHGERREQHRDDGHSEVRYGSFTRSVRLPKGTSADDVRAQYEGGVLQVTVPLADTAPQPVSVPVSFKKGMKS